MGLSGAFETVQRSGRMSLFRASLRKRDCWAGFPPAEDALQRWWVERRTSRCFVAPGKQAKAPPRGAPPACAKLRLSNATLFPVRPLA
jgi:hypothetical protein